jgi:hypothetical protein
MDDKFGCQYVLVSIGSKVNSSTNAITFVLVIRGDDVWNISVSIMVH